MLKLKVRRDSVSVIPSLRDRVETGGLLGLLPASLRCRFSESLEGIRCQGIERDNWHPSLTSAHMHGRAYLYTSHTVKSLFKKY